MIRDRRIPPPQLHPHPQPRRIRSRGAIVGSNDLSGAACCRPAPPRAAGLLLSLRLPFADGHAEAAGVDRFAPNAFIRIDGDGQVTWSCPRSRWGRAPTPRSRC